MDTAGRKGLIKKIEEERDSRVIVYITGDRQQMETRIGMDVFPMFHHHLVKMGAQMRISEQSGHSFRSKVATQFGAKKPPVSV